MTGARVRSGRRVASGGSRGVRGAGGAPWEEKHSAKRRDLRRTLVFVAHTPTKHPTVNRTVTPACLSIVGAPAFQRLKT